MTFAAVLERRSAPARSRRILLLSSRPARRRSARSFARKALSPVNLARTLLAQAGPARVGAERNSSLLEHEDTRNEWRKPEPQLFSTKGTNSQHIVLLAKYRPRG
jgi:hypothetical protein